MAVLGTLDFPENTVPDGYAVPFYFYYEFMKHNGFYDDVKELLADPEFQPDYDTLLFEVFSQHYERGSVMVTTNLPFHEWTEVFGSERLTGALLDRLTHHVNIQEMNGESFRLKRSREPAASQASEEPAEE